MRRETANSIQVDVDELVEGLPGRDEADTSCWVTPIKPDEIETKWLKGCRDRAEGFGLVR